MKKIFTLITALTLSVGLWAINNVPYIDANGQLQYANGVTGIINSTDILEDGWYVVMPTGNEKQTGTLICQGEVHLIVYDGAKLTATGADGKPGIEVSGEGNSLTIYGSTNQSGQLIAIGGANAAGIGGGNAAAGSNITIYGGIVTANGGEYAAGIGGGVGGNGNYITINGGTVTANGGLHAAGIGGGLDGSGSNITINGGIVTATGGDDAAAIGSGNGGDAASNIFVATSFVVKADGNNPPTTVIAATRTATTDIAADLAGQRYATIEKAPDLTYNVTVPVGTKTCYIAGGMTDWSFTEMTKVDDTHYTITAGPGEYRYCSGPGWNYVELDAQGGEVSNRTYSESDVVASWKAVYDPALPKVDETGITVNGRKYGFPVRLVTEVPAGVSGNGTEQYKNNSNPDWFSSK